jgi:UDP-N-acetylglucosamine:LPS N-acetylglucosamine transferase
VTPKDVSSAKILETLNMFFDDAFKREALSENAKKLFDGMGVYRVAEMVVRIAEMRI